MDASCKRVQDRNHDSSRNQSTTEVFNERIKRDQATQSSGIDCNAFCRDGYRINAPGLWPTGSRSDLVQPVGRTQHSGRSLLSTTSGPPASREGQVCVVGSGRREGSREETHDSTKSVMTHLTKEVDSVCGQLPRGNWIQVSARRAGIRKKRCTVSFLPELLGQFQIAMTDLIVSWWPRRRQSAAGFNACGYGSTRPRFDSLIVSNFSTIRFCPDRP
jgi:hypothetical protein